MQGNTVKILFLVGAFIFTAIPALVTLNAVGGLEHWHGVLPRGTADSLYYYARMHEVQDGHPFVGHPYLYEHKQEYSPAFFIPDIVTALPLLAHIPFNVSVLINIFVWSFVFLALAYKTLTLLSVKREWAVVWSFFLYISSYSFVLRPTVMQLIFPLCFAFLVSYLLFLYEPLSKKRALLLSVISALTFYTYSYLALFVGLTLIISGLWFLFSKQFNTVRAFLRMGVYIALGLIPFVLYSSFKASGAFYEETLIRIGLVHTHIPTLDAFFFGRWIIIGLGAFTLLWFLFTRKEENTRPRQIFWITTGGALFMGLFFNVITGVEAFFAIHVGRFVILWMTILLGVLLHEWYTSSSLKGKWITLGAHAVIGCFVALLMFGVARNIPRALAFFNFDTRESALIDVQSYRGPLEWLEKNVPNESVIFANLSFGDYVVTMTKHYTLFNNNAVLHAVSDRELEERYLLWRSFRETSIDDIRHEFAFYAGAGATQEQPLSINNRSFFCKKMSRFVNVGTCPEKTDGLTLRGEAYFEGLRTQLESVKKDRTRLLGVYRVEYFVVDTLYDAYTLEPPRENAAYADGRFFIYPITAVLEI